MIQAVNTSKITPPRLHNVLDRPRLMERLENNTDKRVILIVGQAAQGKSTMAASYVQRSQIPAAWINFDMEDSDPVNLFYSIVQAVQYVYKGDDFSTLLSYPTIRMGPRLEISLYREWANAMFASIEEPTLLFLDALDRLTPDAPSYGFIQTLIDQAPAHIQILLLSREEPPLNLQGLKIRQETSILTNEDLAFTQDETRTFLQKKRGLSLTASQTKRIHQFTEGWIGGMILLSEALNRTPQVSIEQFIAENIPDRFKREVFNYFGEEILRSQPVPIQDFFVTSSILDSIVPSFVNELLGIENAEDILEESTRRNLFVTTVDDEKKDRLYRYHKLFRDFLTSRLKQEFSEEKTHTLLRKAGSLYEQQGEWEQAVSFYLKAQAVDLAAAVIERIGMDVLNAGRQGDLARWLQALPETMVQGNPWLLLYLSVIRRYTAVGENFVSLQKAFTLFEQQGDVRGQLLALAYHIDACMVRGRDDIPLSILIDQADDLLRSIDPDQYHYERAVLWVEMSFGFTVRYGDARRGLVACQNASLLAKREGHVLLQANTLMNALEAHAFLGEFSFAEGFIETIDRLLKTYPHQELRAFFFIEQCALWLFKGEFEKGEEVIRTAQKVIEEYGLVYLYPYTLLYECMLEVNREHFDGTEAMAHRLLELSSSLGNSFLQGATLGLQGIGLYKKGDFQQAKEFLEASSNILSSRESRSIYHLTAYKLLFPLIAYHLKEDMTSYEGEIQALIDHAERISDYIFLAEGHFAMAFVHWRQGKTFEAGQHLAQGFKIAEEKGLTYFWHLGSRDLLRVCLLALKLKVASAEDYASYLLVTRLGSRAEPDLQRLSKHPDKAVRDKARKLRTAIHRSQVPLLRIETLGDFRVSRGEHVITESEWERTSAQTLLKAIVSRGSHKVPRDVLIEELWPEQAPDIAQKNFKVTLHRLRKSLEPQMDKTFGSSYVHLHDALVSLDEERCEIDIETFSSLVTKGQLEEGRGERKTAESLYEQAIALYKGDFLPQDLYAPWTEERKNRAQLQYIVILLKLGKMCEERGATKKAISFYTMAIDIDPTQEDACRRVMDLYHQKGQRNQALKLYERCRRALESELDTEPEASTVALYTKIKKSGGDE